MIREKEKEDEQFVLNTQLHYCVLWSIFSVSVWSMSWFSWAYNLCGTRLIVKRNQAIMSMIWCVYLYLCIYGRMMWPSPASTKLWLMRSKIGNVDLVAWIYDKENECLENHKKYTHHTLGKGINVNLSRWNYTNNDSSEQKISEPLSLS